MGRVPPRKTELDPVPFSLEKNGYYATSRYFRAIDLVFDAEAFETLQGIQVEVGSLEASVTRDNMATLWEITPLPDNRVHLVSKPGLSLRRSRIPELRGILNWSGDFSLLKRALVRAVEIAAVGLAFGILLFVLYKILRATSVLSREIGRPLFGVSLVMFVVFLIPVANLKSLGAFYYGGNTGFIQDTVGSLVSGYLYDREYGAILYSLLIGLAMGLCIFGTIWLLRRAATGIRTSAALFLSLLLVLAVSEISQFFLLKTPYVMGRYALSFWPVYVSFLIFLTEDVLLDLRPPFQKALSSAMIVLALLQAVHFAGCANVSFIREWRYDAGTRALLASLDANSLVQKRKESGRQVKLGLFWPFHPGLQYYLQRSPRAWLDVDLTRTEDVSGMLALHKDYDFLYVDDLQPVNKAKLKYDILVDYPESRTFLLSVEPQP